MKPLSRRLPQRTFRLSTLCCVSIVALVTQSCSTFVALPKSLDTTNCDPLRSDQCWSVSTGFVEQRFYLEDQNIRLKEALKSCREKL